MIVEKVEAIRPGIVGLWELIDAYGLDVSTTFNMINVAETLWRSTPNTRANPFSAMTGEKTASALPIETEISVAQSCSNSAIVHARQLCAKLNWPDVLPEIQRLETRLKYANGDTAAQDFRHLANTLRDRLGAEYFFHVDRPDVQLYGKGELFGPLVAAKFNLSEDIEAAGNCLALGQSTACVFHLMRIMEVALHRLGKVLQVKFDPAKQSWFQICNDASKAAVNRPAKTRQQKARNAALGAAASHLQTVRLAWRNEVMHPKQTYTQEQAREVFNATRTFMVDLAGLF